MTSRIWVGIASVLTLGLAIIALMHQRESHTATSPMSDAPGSLKPDDHPALPAAIPEKSMSATPAQSLQAQLRAYALNRQTLSATEKHRQSEILTAQLEQAAAQGNVDPQEAASMAELLVKDMESDPSRQEQRYAEIRARLRDMSTPPASPTPEQQQKNEIYAAQSREIIEDVFATVPEPEQRPIAIQARMQALRKRIYGDNGPGDQRSLFETH